MAPQRRRLPTGSCNRGTAAAMGETPGPGPGPDTWVPWVPVTTPPLSGEVITPTSQIVTQLVDEQAYARHSANFGPLRVGNRRLEGVRA